MSPRFRGMVTGGDPDGKGRAGPDRFGIRTHVDAGEPRQDAMNGKHGGDGHVGGAHEFHEVPKVPGIRACDYPGHKGEDSVGGRIAIIICTERA